MARAELADERANAREAQAAVEAMRSAHSSEREQLEASLRAVRSSKQAAEWAAAEAESATEDSSAAVGAMHTKVAVTAM